MPLAEFEPEIPEIVRPQTHPLDREVTGIGHGKFREVLTQKNRAKIFMTMGAAEKRKQSTSPKSGL
jgi:hypothetical protein